MFRVQFDGDIRLCVAPPKSMFLMISLVFFEVFCDFFVFQNFHKITDFFFLRGGRPPEIAAAAATAAAAAAAEAAISARRQRRRRKEKIWNLMKNMKNADFGGATHKRMSPSNSTRKTTHIDLFSSLYD